MVLQLWILIGTAVVMLLGCSTTKKLNETHIVKADTLAQELRANVQASTDISIMDSLLTVILHRQQNESSSSEIETETISEIITTTTDSLGCQQRTEQRTKTRTTNREQQQREELWKYEMEQWYKSLTARQDSLLSTSILNVQSHRSDSLLVDNETVYGKSNTVPWYRQWWNNLQYMIMGAVLALGLWLTRRWWNSIKKRCKN